MNGGGDPNVVQNINHKDRHVKWFFVYFGYSKKDRAAYSYVKWTDNEDNLNFANINHYFAAKFHVFVGRDAHFPGFNGKLAYVNFNIGGGAFRKGNDFTRDDDAFGFAIGGKELFKPVKPDALPEPDKDVRESKSTDAQPVVDRIGKDNDELSEYGYGFWLRFLTAYPERLLHGKNQPWYFVSRLTVN